eukprot:gnl/Hemi2/27983_TR9240_c0_g1_i1.p1 gnl/Hemi2/27983_TR9240_c0_g1~~gnl/Hemi2/27983_TR9240_c0_g1_i1.p1  ORF type:complete len:199 (+),score=26.12 gnl/Hemi2/27983_TR9240_c0_g1_i1:181-777(+)
MVKVLLLVGDYVEDYEAMIPLQMLGLCGHTVHAVSPGKKAGDRVRTAVHFMVPGEQSYTELREHDFTINFDFDAIKAEAYAGLVLPGGRSPEYLRLDPRVNALTQHFVGHDKPIATICHGPQLLPAGALQGKRVTGYAGIQPEMVAMGAVWDHTCPLDGVCVDGNLVSSPFWTAIPNWMRAFLELLGTRIEQGLELKL